MQNATTKPPKVARVMFRCANGTVRHCRRCRPTSNPRRSARRSNAKGSSTTRPMRIVSKTAASVPKRLAAAGEHRVSHAGEAHDDHDQAAKSGDTADDKTERHWR